MNYVIIGFKGCGKTAVGKELADILAYGFLDIDDMIEKEYKKNEGESLNFREIYRRSEKIFRKLETKALKDASKKDSIVLATGGSTPVKNKDLIKSIGKTVYLEVDEDILYKRIMKNGVPAFFNIENPKESFREMIKERKRIYESIADITVKNQGDLKKVAEKIIS